ncbi:N-methyl-L-tryptophan oxidase [Mycetocola manganoxydans]|uniref:N-methyl-L-tryptophan oxidase n=1 Tax=Mycetocola manganoxydans TaxID=699879 RepID=A0A3L6ZYV0_9MICO|nr:N-methyl-L-tryptophan oxidase [Mycetocola manganoxydans]RLP72994.1 N-methyl-L-tryptophan oxidase [Mycetocola manganoxydans]GHD44636.1 N-methyltryptophan oxidase [Mycetocola manganoxydans]
MSSADVIVIGLGSMGGAAANALAQRGLSVLGFERFWPSHDQGSAHGGTRIIRQSYFEGVEYVPLLRRAYEGWRQLEDQAEAKLVTITGGIYIGDPEEETFTGALSSAREWNLQHEVLSSDEITERFPAMRPADHAVGLFEENAGFVDPERTTAANIRVATEHGARLHFGEAVLSWTATRGGGVEVVTRHGTYGADRLVVAPGAWSAQLLGEVGAPVTAERQVMYWFQPGYSRGRPVFEDYAVGRQPVFIERTDGNEQVYGFPIADGSGGGIKIGFFHDERPTDPDAVDRTVLPFEIARMQSRALELFPHLTGPLLQAKTCLYPSAPDDHFMIGLHPEHSQVTVATGFGGHGFKFVPVVGDIVADLASRGRTDLPIGLFDLERPALLG